MTGNVKSTLQKNYVITFETRNKKNQDNQFLIEVCVL